MYLYFFITFLSFSLSAFLSVGTFGINFFFYFFACFWNSKSPTYYFFFFFFSKVFFFFRVHSPLVLIKGTAPLLHTHTKKKKMAKENAKRNLKKNQQRMRTFKLITVLINILYLLLVFVYHRQRIFYWRSILGLAFWLSQEVFCLHALESFGKPTYGADGVTLRSCTDLSNPAELRLYSFAQDILWVCWAVQLLCGFHGFFFVFYIPVPGIILYKVYSFAKPFLGALLGRNGGGPMDATENVDQSKSREARRKEALDRRKGRIK